MFRRTLDKIAPYAGYFRLPCALRREFRKDLTGPDGKDPGAETIMDLGVKWLFRGQDHSASGDGGVARHFELLTGWSSSYPETTGYIIPTILDYACTFGKPEGLARARRMVDWLLSIQFPDGGFQGGAIGERPRRPVIFNTGQILLGLAAGARQFGNDCLAGMIRAADWLVGAQDPDGCWRKYPTPFAAPGEKSYETHVAWGLFEAARIEQGRGYGEAGLKNVYWALTCQREDGWFEKCCLTYPSRPLTHTLGYALRGAPGSLQVFRRPPHFGRVRQDCRQSGADGQGRRLPPWPVFPRLQARRILVLFNGQRPDQLLLAHPLRDHGGGKIQGCRPARKPLSQAHGCH